MPKQKVNSVAAVIEALGGRAVCAQLLGVTYQAVHNWRARKHFPPHTFHIMTSLLAAKRLTAPPKLWGMQKFPTATRKIGSNASNLAVDGGES